MGTCGSWLCHLHNSVFLSTYIDREKSSFALSPPARRRKSKSPGGDIPTRRYSDSIEFNATDERIICGTLRKSDHDLATAASRNGECLLHCRLISAGGRDIEVAQNLAAVDRHIELPLACCCPGQLRPINLGHIGCTGRQ